jgi:hypothetical protein
MNWNLVRMLCIFLMVTLPMGTGAQLVQDEDYEEYDTGESLIVAPRSYEPTILTVNLLQDSDVPVFVFLGGYSWGTILGVESNVEPFYSGIDIEKVKIRAADSGTADMIKGDVKYTRPNKITEESLGYLTIYLNQINSDTADICEKDSECGQGFQCDGICVPTEINLTLNAEIWFTKAERLYSLSKTALVVPQYNDEDDWVAQLGEYGSMYSFFGGRGLVRVADIDGDEVEIVVYSNKDMYWPIVGAPRGISSVTLKEGETSDYIDLGFTDEQILTNAKFRIAVTDIADPAEVRAVVRVNVQGKESQVVVTEGSPLYPGSSWTVTSISYGVGRAGPEYTLVITDSKGNRETLVTEYTDELTDAESELLGKVFYDYLQRDRISVEDRSNGLYYTSSTKTIAAQTIEKFKENLRVYQDTNAQPVIDLEIDSLTDTNAMTRAYTLREGATIKEMLIQTLPAGMYYEILSNGQIKVAEFSSKDPCDGATIYAEGDLPATYVQYDTEFYLAVACSGVKEYSRAIVEYENSVYQDGGSESVGNLAYKGIGDLYIGMLENLDGILSEEELIGARERALEAYQELQARGYTDNNAPLADKIVELEQELTGGIVYGDETIDDNGKFVFVKFISMEVLEPEDLSSATISKDGLSETYYVGDKIVSDEDSTGTFAWYLREVDESYVKIKKIYSEKLTSKAKESTERLSFDQNEDVAGSVLRLKEVDTKKEAHITIIPGTGGALRSKSNFSVHIPIETRGIKLNIEKIDDKIAKMKDRQETLEGIVDSLTKIVEYWNKACLAVFAFVTIKSSFFGSSSADRHDAIYGVDDQSGWNAYCQKQASGDCDQQARTCPTFDECMMENADNIADDIEAAKEAREQVESFGGDFTGEPWYEDAVAEYGGAENLDECRSLIGDEVYMSQTAIEEMAYYNFMSGQVSDQMQSSVDNGIQSYTGENSVDQKAKGAACQQALASVEAQKGYLDSIEVHYDDKDKRDEQEKVVALGAFETAYNQKLVSDGIINIPDVKDFPSMKNEFLGDDTIIVVSKIFQEPKTKGSIVYHADAQVEVRELIYSDYKTNFLEPRLKVIADVNSDGEYTLKPDLKDDAEMKTALSRLVNDLEKFGTAAEGEKFGTKSSDKVVGTDGKKFYVGKSKNVIYVGTPAYSTDALNEDFAEGAKLEIYGTGEYQGMPFCLPHKNGNYVKIIEYNKINDPSTLQYWNVGPDGHLCTSDDVLVQHESELLYSSASPSVSTLISFSNTYVRKTFNENEVVNIDNHDFKVSYGKSKVTLEGASGSCYDTMDPQDCKLMFNTCDPVMCPPSRFNMNGRWNVDNVVESGFIGSLFLGQGTGDTVPICLTGVLASLNWWNSMLEGYVQCLEAAKYEGDTVGICDKVRSVFWCEVGVREVGSLLGYNGGMLDFMAEKFYGDRGEGSEYFQFQDNMQNMQNAVTYFTTDYASTAFAAFKGRSFEEVGGEFCKQAIYSKMPWFEDFLAQVTTPEDPNQFYASLTVKPHSETLQLSAYQTYYHIYAGVNENIASVTYSVYLRNSLTGEVFYTTDNCESVSSSIELGEMKDETVDCTANEGFDEVCVVLNGETTCGFGSVTTSFAADFLKDSLVADEVKRDIGSEEECYPSSSRASPTLSQVGSAGITDSLALPYSFGLLETGVQRVCSVSNPGSGQGDSGDWSIVGTCGENNEGQSLGSCWINQDSYTIHDALKEESTSEYLSNVNWNYSKQLLGYEQSELWDTEKTGEKYNEYYQVIKNAGTLCENNKIAVGTTSNDLPAEFDQAIALFNILKDKTLNIDYAGAAQLNKGVVYQNLVNNCKLKGNANIDYKMKLNGNSVFTSDKDLGLEEGKVEFEVTFINLPEKVTVDESSNWKCAFSRDSEDLECYGSVEVDKNLDELLFSVKITDNSNGEVIVDKEFTMTRAAAQESKTSSSDADDCGTCPGYSGITKYVGSCDLTNCRLNGDSCYLHEGSWPDTCRGCAEIEDQQDNDEDRCSELDGDERSCERSSCYKQFLDSGVCVWDSGSNSCEHVVTSTGAVDSIALAAAAEYERWDKGKLIECKPEAEEIITEYFEAGNCAGGNAVDCANSNREPGHWSAGYVSYVMQEAGYDDFSFHCNHNGYFGKIRDGDSDSCYTVEISKVDEIYEGDIICYCPDDRTTCNYNQIHYYSGEDKDLEYRQLQHCDIVVEVDGDTVYYHGGNLGDSSVGTVPKRSISKDGIISGKVNSRIYPGIIRCAR